MLPKKNITKYWYLPLIFIILSICSQVTFAKRKTNCGLVCYRWGKCKLNISALTSGGQRPGQAGTTGQLFFTKCGDPPEGCECTYEPPKVGPAKPKFPKLMFEFVNDDAKAWLTNLVDVVSLREI